MASETERSSPKGGSSGTLPGLQDMTQAPVPEHSGGGLQDQLARADSFTNRLITLHEISLQIDAADTRQAILDLLRTELKWLVPGDLSMVCLLDRFESRYAVTLLVNPPDQRLRDGSVYTLNEGIAGVVIQTQSPMLVDLAETPGPPNSPEDLLRSLGMSSVLSVPLQGGNETIGALVVASATHAAYGVQDLAIARLLGSQVAIALQNIGVFEDAKKRIVQIELVNELAEHLTSTLEPNVLLQSATETIQKTFNYSDVTILLADKAGNIARLVAHTGVSPSLVPMQYTQSLSEGIIGWVATHGEAVLANDVSQDSRFINPSALPTRAELAIPIRVDREVVGILNVEDERPHVFDETDAVVLETLCDQLGSALRNAQLYDELRRTNAKLTELDKMKSDFLSIVSHDFRSPLASIMLAARSLMRNEGDDAPKNFNQYLKVIEQQSERLITLAEDTLSITRLESGKLTYLFNAVNLERLMMDAAAMVSFSTRHALKFNFEKGLPYARGDQAKLRQVVQNLLSNAVKYSPRGGLIEVSARPLVQDQILVSISDQGIGIPPEQMDRLFRKFSRVDSEDAHRIRGTGLGLWISKEIVKAHGGDIWVESQAGKGSVFHFTLRTAQGEGAQPS